MARIKQSRSDVLASGNYYPLRKDFIKVLGLRGTAAILFTVIYSYSLNDDLQGSYFGTRQTLAEELGISVASLSKHINRLIKMDLIEKNITKRNGQWVPTYRVDIEKMESKITNLIEEKFNSAM